MNERLIWRPNAFTPEEWDKLSRDQQIVWWKDQEDREQKGPPMHPLRATRLYRKGIITEAEISTFVFVHLTEENVQEFLDACPADFLQQLREKAGQLPANDDNQGWGQLVSIEGVSYLSWVSGEEIQQRQQERRRRFREGVQTFRTHK